VAGFEREVALKLVHAHLRADEESRLHLLEEARLAARIRHPNVVPVTEVDADACGVFLVMDYVEGEALSGLVRLLRDQNHRLPPRLIARIMNDALAGLHAAHELRDAQGQFVGLVHRDFSPQNILLGIEGVTRLADFGVAKAASRTVRTKTGLVKGKVAYMSPEQARGHKVDRRCDVWAAGVVVWELVTGRKLYDHEDDVATLLSVVTEEPPRLSSVMQGVPSALDEAVAYALTSDVNNRCPSAEALRCMLESAWDECGGMATTPELGAFVRQTVGQRLAERRALVARGRTSSAPLSGVSGTSAAPALPVANGAEARVPEDGTKTAISAAVPAADRIDAPRAHRLSRRSMGVAALLSISVLAAVMGVAVRSPEEHAPSSAGVQNPGAGVPEAPRAVGQVAEETNSWPSEDPENVLAEPAEAAVAHAASEVALEPQVVDAPLLPLPSADMPNPRRSSARHKATAAKPKPKSPSRSNASGSRSGKQVAATTRVLPIPQPSERQLRNKKPRTPVTSGPAPLNLAPDPYDSNR
jgi:serine/threonine-protein kinase